MTTTRIDAILAAQRAYFATGATLSPAFRIAMLKKLKAALLRHEEELIAALGQDLGKSGFEGYMCEIGMTHSELTHLIRHTAAYARRRHVSSPLAQFPSASFVQPTPYGNALIMSPWNYPVLLTLGPLATAIAAGNTVILKPSAYSPATSALLSRLIGECFDEQYVAVVTGGREENACLLEKKFDFIFFTGSQTVGREVLRRAAEHLTPAVLELGGKSPCIVDETAKLPLAAKRIVFGKFLNCGQTCVAPDYLLCQSSVKDALLQEIRREIAAQFGEQPLENSDYGKIISPKHFERIRSLMDADKIVIGGRCDEAALRIEPTVMDSVTWSDAVMGQEIFGPVLPVLTFDSFEEIFPLLADKPKPLALYFFSENRERIDAVTSRCRYGGGCINDTIIHLATSAMGFGGVGESGMGAYHGKVGFDTFSHLKSIVDKKTWLDLPMRYQPYRPFHEKLLRLFLR